MENENKILKEVQQSSKVVLSLIAKQNKTTAMQYDSLKNDLAYFMKKTMIRFERIDEKFQHVNEKLGNIGETMETMNKKVERVELATLENRADFQNLNTNIKRIAHNHETRITRLENEVAA